MKKVQDHYFKKAKKDNYPARSVYKLEEAQKKFQILQRNDKVLDLGCHPGSWTKYVAGIVGGKGRVVGIDLQQCRIKGLPGGAEIELIRGDIFEPELTVLQKAGFDVVLSDMAPKTSSNKFVDHVKSVELARRALEIANKVLRKNGHFYCKVFQGEDFPGFVEEMRQFFSKVKVVKPKSSRSESREVYVLGMNLLK